MELIMGGDIAGSSLQGYIDIHYEDLVRIFGEPNMPNDGYKVDAEWAGRIDGVFFTIYNYKDGLNYNGETGLPVEEITDWHIGGFSKEAHRIVSLYIEMKRS